LKIYTKTGDTGDTSLFGGDRVRKNSRRIEAYGTVDELNSAVGFARAASRLESITKYLETVQHDLFTLGADLATPLNKENARIERVSSAMVDVLEAGIDAMEAEMPPIKYFILPGGSELASRLHLCRTVCRRAERAIVALADGERILDEDILYINRLSDFLFVIARYANYLEGVPDIPWKSPRT